nr:MAG: putative RNA-dependent RNA polymerase [Botoulivirus sp.]
MVVFSSLSPKRRAPCPAGGSLVKALNRVIEIVSREFSLTHDPIVLLTTDDCSSIRQRWDELASELVSRCKNRKRARLSMLFKGCKRLFDRQCLPCDKKLGESARRAWDARVGMPVPYGNTICSFYAARLQKHVRVLADGWGKRLEACRKDTREPYRASDIYVPDQQGCLEEARGTGGTLSVSEESTDYSLVRRGVAKQKGKFRVVTMQSARVKRVLRPVHNALYDHLSSFGWCVRGDVQKEDFLSVLDSTDEDLVSGDFNSATDLIYLPAVEAVCSVLSEDTNLTVEEREVLLGSFSNLRWISQSGNISPILRGSMMGNLVSFPLLCLINKACHDIAAEEVYGPEVRRVGRFNGDDCLFGASPEMYRKWRLVTSIYGLSVNESKTMFTRRWADLNSQTFDCARRNLVSKPVLSFLRPSDDSPGEIFSSVICGISSFGTSVQQWIVNVLMRYEISLRGFTLSSIPSRWCRILVKKKWFRKMVWRDRTPVRRSIRSGGSFERLGDGPLATNLLSVEDRSFPTTLGPPPVRAALPAVTELCALLSKEHTDAWKGVRCIPRQDVLDRVAFRKEYDSPISIPETRFVGVSVRWCFLWPSALLQIVSDRFPSLLISDKDALVWSTIDYSPYLTLEHRFRVVRSKKTYVNPFTPLTPSDPRWSPFNPCIQYPLG